jgi:hypothetical protein
VGGFNSYNAFVGLTKKWLRNGHKSRINFKEDMI